MTQKIKCAAIKAPNGKIFAIDQPARHADIRSSMRVEGHIIDHSYTDGFLTTENKFVNRKEALFIAEMANQLLRSNCSGWLSTDDVW